MDLIPFAGYDVTRKVDAVFENGLLRPLHPIEGIDEHARVHLTIEGVEPSLEEVTPTNDVLLSLAKSHPPPPQSWWEESDDPFVAEEGRSD